VLIPRGSQQLIRYIQEKIPLVPVDVAHGEGNVMCLLDSSANLKNAEILFQCESAEAFRFVMQQRIISARKDCSEVLLP